MAGANAKQKTWAIEKTTTNLSQSYNIWVRQKMKQNHECKLFKMNHWLLLFLFNPLDDNAEEIYCTFLFVYSEL